MHATEKLDQEVAVTMPVKFLSAIVRALMDGAELHQLHLATDDGEMDPREFMTRAACIKCYGEVFDLMSEAMKQHLSEDDVAVLRQVAEATVNAEAEHKGVMN
jgi:hypothetical protein